MRNALSAIGTTLKLSNLEGGGPLVDLNGLRNFFLDGRWSKGSIGLEMSDDPSDPGQNILRELRQSGRRGIIEMDISGKVLLGFQFYVTSIKTGAARLTIASEVTRS